MAEGFRYCPAAAAAVRPRHAEVIVTRIHDALQQRRLLWRWPHCLDPCQDRHRKGHITRAHPDCRAAWCPEGWRARPRPARDDTSCTRAHGRTGKVLPASPRPEPPPHDPGSAVLVPLIPSSRSPKGAALLRRRPRGLLRAARQELLDPSKAWWGGRRGRLADRPRYSISVSLGVVPLVLPRRGSPSTHRSRGWLRSTRSFRTASAPTKVGTGRAALAPEDSTI